MWPSGRRHSTRTTGRSLAAGRAIVLSRVVLVLSVPVGGRQLGGLVPVYRVVEWLYSTLERSDRWWAVEISRLSLVCSPMEPEHEMSGPTSLGI
jgi:hypothetical protein